MPPGITSWGALRNIESIVALPSNLFDGVVLTNLLEVQAPEDWQGLLLTVVPPTPTDTAVEMWCYFSIDYGNGGMNDRIGFTTARPHTIAVPGNYCRASAAIYSTEEPAVIVPVKAFVTALRSPMREPFTIGGLVTTLNGVGASTAIDLMRSTGGLGVFGNFLSKAKKLVITPSEANTTLQIDTRIRRDGTGPILSQTLIPAGTMQPPAISLPLGARSYTIANLGPGVASNTYHLYEVEL